VNEDYYDPYPRLSLERPVLIAGQLGCGAASMGRLVSARTGLAFCEIDRLIEHEAGCSLAKLANEQGGGRIERLAETTLDRVSRQTPFGLIVLDRAWLPATARSLLRRRLDFIHVQRDAAHLRERWGDDACRGGGWLQDAVRAAEQQQPGSGFEAALRAREPLLAEATILLDAQDQHPHRMAEVLMEALESLASFRARRVMRA